MRGSRWVAVVAGAVFLLSGLAKADQKPPSLDAASQAFDEALKKHDVEAVFAHMTDDVVMMPPGEPTLRGKAAAREWYSWLLSQYKTSSLVLTQREVIVGEGVGAVIGAHEWILKPVAGGEPVVDRGSYMQVWKQQADGRWLFAREIWNSSAPPAAQ